MYRPAVAVGCSLALALPAVVSAAPRAGQPAPALTLPSLGGQTVTLSSLRGKPVYVNFFATWCVPCNEEATVIGKLSDRYKARGLVVLGINELEDVHKAKAFIDRYSLHYTALVDKDGKSGKDYGVLGLPVHIFINRSGVVSVYRLGEMNAEEIEAAIKGIL